LLQPVAIVELVCSCQTGFKSEFSWPC